MLRRIITIGILAVLCMPQLTSAQDLKAEMEHLYQQYLDAQTISMKLEVEIYKGHHATTPEIIKKGELLRNGTDFYYQWDGLGYLQTCEAILVLDHAGKKIIHKGTPKDYEKSFDYTQSQLGDMFKQMDTLLAKTNDVIYMGNKNGRKRYKIHQDKGMIETMIMEFDSESGALLASEYYYNLNSYTKHNKVVINYLEMDFTAKVDPTLFDASKFITKAGKSILPASQFKGYEIIDNDQKPEKF